MSAAMSTEDLARRMSMSRRPLPSYGGAVDSGIESFWAVELKEGKREEVWSFKDEVDPEADKDEEPDKDFMTHQLYLKMATLGASCEKGAQQVVTVETLDKDQNVVKVPLVNLVAGVSNTICINASFSDEHKVTFRLAEGDGPVYLTGCCLQEFPPTEMDSQDESMFTETETATDEEEDEVEEEEEDEDDVEDEEDSDEEMEVSGKKGKAAAGTKRKAVAATKASKAKQRSRKQSESKTEESEEEDSDEDEDDEEYEEPSTKSKKSKAGASKAVASKSPKGAKAKAAQAAKGKAKKGKAK